MISFEKAKALKEAGLKQEPKKGDCMSSGDMWLPRLDQLLAEIERRGYAWSLKLLNRPQYRVILYPKGLAPGGNGSSIFTADTPEDAAADALLLILKQEGK